jgi:hypothetical protein
MKFNLNKRRALLATAALLAGAGGAGLAWRRLGSESSDEALPDHFWQLALLTPEGQDFSMAQLRGNPLLINFWATWCPPCIEELPLLDRFYQENLSKRWQVIGLAVDKPKLVLDFLKQHPVTFPIAMAGSGGVSLSNALGNSGAGLPFTVVLDSKGKLRHRKMGKVSLQELQGWQNLD